MKFVKRRLLSIVLCAVVLFSGMTVSVCAKEQTLSSAETTVDVMKNDFTKLIGIAKYGDTVSFPENSAEGILSAAEKGADMVLVSVKKTADGIIVLLSDDNLSRTVADADGNSVDKNISDVGLSELEGYYLKNGKGGVSESVTSYKIQTLSQVLEKTADKTVIVIENAYEYKDEIYEILVNENRLNSCILCLQADKGDISSWLSEKTAMPLVFAKFKGTVVWKSRSFIKKTAKAGAVGVVLCSSNAYSMTFNKNTVAKTDNKMRAVIDMTDPDLCGKRTDTPLYWDDVTSRGFSVIITENPEQFYEYSQRTEKARERLADAIDSASKTDLTLCSTNSANALKEKLIESKRVYSQSVCANEIENEYYELSKTVNSLTDVSADNSASTVTKGRIIAAVSVVIGLIIMETAFEIFRNKSIKLRKIGKKLYGKNKYKR